MRRFARIDFPILEGSEVEAPVGKQCLTCLDRHRGDSADAVDRLRDGGPGGRCRDDRARIADGEQGLVGHRDNRHIAAGHAERQCRAVVDADRLE